MVRIGGFSFTLYNSQGFKSEFKPASRRKQPYLVMWTPIYTHPLHIILEGVPSKNGLNLHKAD